MKIITLCKRGVICACGCGDELPRGDIVSKIDGKYYKLYCGKIYRLHTGVMRFIKGVVNARV